MVNKDEGSGDKEAVENKVGQQRTKEAENEREGYKERRREVILKFVGKTYMYICDQK